MTVRRICVVDDNRSAAFLLKALIAKVGQFEIVSFTDGPALLTHLQSNHAEIIFLDIGLPTMDGHAIARSIRQQNQFNDILLVAVTGRGEASDIADSLSSGFDLHLVKPASLDDLRRVFLHDKVK